MLPKVEENSLAPEAHSELLSGAFLTSVWSIPCLYIDVSSTYFVVSPSTPSGVFERSQYHLVYG